MARLSVRKGNNSKMGIIGDITSSREKKNIFQSFWEHVCLNKDHRKIHLNASFYLSMKWKHWRVIFGWIMKNPISAPYKKFASIINFAAPISSSFSELV